MREVGAFEAKNKLGQLLDLVERGEEVTITRHGKEVPAWCPSSMASTVRKRAPRCDASASARNSSSWDSSTGPSGKPFGTKAVRESRARRLRHACLDLW